MGKLVCVVCGDTVYAEPSLGIHLRAAHNTTRLVDAVVRLTSNSTPVQLTASHVALQKWRQNWRQPLDRSPHQADGCLLCRKQAELAKNRSPPNRIGP